MILMIGTLMLVGRQALPVDQADGGRLPATNAVAGSVSGLAPHGDAVEAEPAGDQPLIPGVGAYNPWRSLLAMVVLLGGLIAVNRYVRRRMDSGSGIKARRMAIVERLGLGGKCSLALVDVDGLRVLVGLGQGAAVSLLALGASAHTAESSVSGHTLMDAAEVAGNE